MAQKEINMKLMRKVLAHIKSDFRRLNMGTYGELKGSESAQMEKEEGCLVNPNRWPSCNTKACMAGWTVLVSTPKSQWKSLFEKDGDMKTSTHSKARKLLGLSVEEANEIFTGNACWPSCWPSTAKEQYSLLKEDINEVLEARDMKERV